MNRLLAGVTLCLTLLGSALFFSSNVHSKVAGASMVVTARRHGWFAIPGIQTGEHTVKSRLQALASVIRYDACGADILDVGCAEGLMSKWLIDNCAAASVHGLDCHEPFLRTAESLLQGYDAKLFHVDLNHLAYWRRENPGLLRDKYRIVLATCIVQKMVRPADLLRELADLSSKYILIQAPDEVIDDPRSNRVKLNITEALAPEFEPVVTGRLGQEFLAVYRRIV